MVWLILLYLYYSSRRRHTRFDCDWSSDVCSSDLGARVVLDENPDESLHGSDDGPVQHHRYPARVVLGDVLRAEQSRHGKIDLHGAALPGATDAVFQMVFDLGTVKGALPREQVVDEAD